MTAIAMRSSVLGIKKQTVAGDPVDPASATDYLPMQDDFEIDPAYETLDSAELRGSIGQSESIIGTPAPSASMSYYPRGSGVEGQAPGCGPIMEAFFGTQNANGTERTATGGSTVSSVVLGAGGTDFARGRAILVKYTDRAWEVRALASVATNTLVPIFNLPAAPASGIAMGKCVSWSPANEDHPILTLNHYMGNGGMREMVPDVRVLGISTSIAKGELVVSSFTFEGTDYYRNPIKITSATKYIDFEDDGGNKSVALTEGWYHTPHELAAHAQSVMDAASTATITVTFSPTTGKFTFTAAGHAVFKLEWGTGTNTANSAATKFGFAVADETGALTYTSDNAQTYGAPHTPTYDSAKPIVAKAMQVLCGTATDTTPLICESIEIDAGCEKTDLEDLNEESGISGSIMSSRSVAISITGLCQKHDAQMFERMRNGDTIGFQAVWGAKSGGNWVPGYTRYAASPTATVVGCTVTNDGGLAKIELELRCFVNASGEGEYFEGQV